MSFNGSGTFVINSSGQPVIANTVISSTVFNALTADLATGLSTCITKDGQTTPTANIPMGTFKFTNLGNGSAATDSATLGQVQASTTKLVTVTGADTIAGTMNPALTAYASGQMFYFIAAGANTGAVTLNIDGLGARNVTRDGSTALAANDILSGEVALVVYDGTRFQLLNPANAGSMTVSNLTVTGTTTLSGLTASTALALDASKNVVSVTNTGTGNNVLATSPTLVTPTLGAASATSVAAGLGAVGTPSYTFTGDLNTGMWSPAADTLAVSTNGVERLRVNDSGVGIGAASGTSSGYATAPQFLNYSASATNLLNASDTSSIIRCVTYRDTTGGGVISAAKFRGTYASPAAVQSGDTSGRLFFDVWGGSNLRRIAEVGALVDTYTSDSNISGTLYFATSTSGNASSNEKMRLTAAGDLGIGTASPAFKLQVSGTQSIGFSVNGTYSGPSILSSGSNNLFIQPNSQYTTFGGNGAGFAATVSISAISGAAGFSVEDSTASNSWLFVNSSGNVGIGTASPTALLDVNANTMRLRTARTPASAGAAGNAGDICWDSSYLYICTATNTWRRIAHATW